MLDVVKEIYTCYQGAGSSGNRVYWPIQANSFAPENLLNHSNYSRGKAAAAKYAKKAGKKMTRKQPTQRRAAY